MKFKISRHAEEEIRHRNIPKDLLAPILETPQQTVEEYGNKKAYQSQIDFGEGKIYLIRVIVDDIANPKVVVTVYKTSKIEKYWRKP